MLIFVKLGGSLITDKTQPETFRAERMAALAWAIAAAQGAEPALQLLVGHGSGSFGHMAASRHQTADGVQSQEQWVGFADVARAAARLNRLVADSLGQAGVPAWGISPSASAECADGVLRYMDSRPVKAALDHGLVPLVHGDVALDTVRGGTIASTESVFFYLAPILQPVHIFLLGEVDGVLDERGRLIRHISPATAPGLASLLGGSHGVDVTGGMLSKVREMVQLVEVMPKLTVHILSGLEAETLRQALLNPLETPGTRITFA